MSKLAARDREGGTPPSTKAYLHYFFRIVALTAAMLFGCLTSGHAQYGFLYRTPIYSFDLPKSMAGNEVQDIYQDRQGYMWFATKAGLVRYDGRDFKVFSHDVTDDTSISSDEVEVILETQAGTLWVGTWGGGLNKLDRKTGTFTHYRSGVGGLSNDFISDLVEDDRGRLWIATRRGLNRLEPTTEEFTVFLPTENDPNSLNHYEVRTLYLDQRNTLWVGTGYPWEENNLGGLNRYDPVTESFTHYFVTPQAGTEDAGNKITALLEDRDNNFWVGTGSNQVYLMDREAGTFRFLEEVSDFPVKTEQGTHIRSFFQADNGSMWVCSYGGGMRNYDLNGQVLLDQLYQDNKDGNSFYPLNQAWKIFRSQDGTLWICTGDIGDNVFKSNALLPNLGLVYPADRIQSIFVSKRSGHTWLGRHLNGLNQSNWQNSTRGFTWTDDPLHSYDGSWSSAQDTEPTALFDNIFTMGDDAYGALWFGKYETAQGLYRFQPSTGTLRRFRHDPEDVHTLATDMVVDIEPAADGKVLWVITDDGTLHQVDAESYRITRIDGRTHPNFPAGLSIAESTPDGLLWLGGVDAVGKLQIAAWNPTTQTILNYPLPESAVSGHDGLLTGLVRDSEKNIWLVSETQIVRLDASRSVSVFNVDTKQHGRIAAVLPDRYGQLWLATSRGISVFQPRDSSVYSYPTDHDLRALPYRPRAAAVQVSGALTFCGTGGCTYINEATLTNYLHRYRKPNTLASEQVLYTEFLLNGKAMKTGPYGMDSILVDHQVRLGHLDNSFSIELALLDFKAPERNHFEYFLENYDTYWRSTGDKNTVYYSQLPPGRYRLLVKGYNVDGEYAEALPLLITVLPPWWRTWWAIALYGLLIAGLFYGAYRFQLSRQLAKSEAKRLQELDTAKTRLYTNITHEFRTPLTVIIGMAEQLFGQVPNAQQLMVEMISRNGQNLLNLVNQMLALSKLESGQMTLSSRHADLITYLKYLVESFHSYAETRSVNIHFLSDLETQYMDFDPDKVQQIISNVLSNAIKFTPVGGNIYLSVNVSRARDNQLFIKVKDTGVGIDPARLPYIFERFYQGDDGPTKEFAGTGVGLALVAELVKLMNGEINARSELGKGTEIIIALPVTNESPPAEDQSYFDQALHQFHREGVAPRRRESTGRPFTEAHRPTILIVEDNYDVRTYIQACLAENFELLNAENGQRGIEKALEHIPDFIISDVMMPVKDGYALVRELKGDRRTSHIPIILLTAKADTDSRLLGLKQGVDAYLAKPFNPEELIVRVNKLLELRQQLQQYFLGSSAKSESDLEEQRGPEHQFVLQINDIIRPRLADPELDVKTICREMNMSHSQLHRKLSALTGLSANRYIRHLRLENAKVLLRDPERSITTVAYDTGFKDPSYFGRVFKRATGMTPAEWQREA